MSRPSAAKRTGEKRWLPIFFGVAACSWMPHWSCHYYRLETDSSFVVGDWDFSSTDSVVNMLIYTALISLNLGAIAIAPLRATAALLSGVLHITIGVVHVVRLVRPYRFEVFDLPWPRGASVREAVIVIGFGILCLAAAWILRPPASAP